MKITDMIYQKPILILLLTFILSGIANILNHNMVLAATEHQLISGPFSTVRDVIAKCVECHASEAEEILQDIHWKWQRPININGDKQAFGKRTELSFFGISAPQNIQICMRCHISHNWTNMVFEQNNPTDIDCLVCHDTTGSYKRNANTIKPQDNLEEIARNVGKPTINNCLECHFSRCGILESDAQIKITDRLFQTDIHMTQASNLFSCQVCHNPNGKHSFSIANDHTIRNDTICSRCHTSTPHMQTQLNDHCLTISCLTCHIPQYGVNRPDILIWNWTLAGRNDSVYYQTEKGDKTLLNDNGFLLAMDILPSYQWDNGTYEIYTRGDRVVPLEITPLKRPSEKTVDSILTPFRGYYSTQLYDTKYRYLISPLLGDNLKRIFEQQDWDILARKGMEEIRLPYSGSYGFTSTVSFRRLTHGTAKASEALDCLDCHGKTGRLDWSSLGYKNDPWQNAQMD